MIHSQTDLKEIIMKKLTALTVFLMMSAGAAVAADQMQTVEHGKPMPHEHKHYGKAKHHSKKNGVPFGMAELNLTEEQKSKIKSIVDADRAQQNQNRHSNQIAKLKQNMQAYRTQEQTLFANKNFDEAKARKMIAQRVQQRAELEKKYAERELQKLKKRHALFQVLTPQQQKQYQENQQKKIDEMKKRHAKRFQIND